MFERLHPDPHLQGQLLETDIVGVLEEDLAQLRQAGLTLWAGIAFQPAGQGSIGINTPDLACQQSPHRLHFLPPADLQFPVLLLLGSQDTLSCCV